MNSYRRPNETMRCYLKRQHVLCMERVEKYYVLQSLRRDQGYFGAALFYQNEAKRWHERAMECRAQWLASGWRVIGLDHAKPGSDRSATFIRIKKAPFDWDATEPIMTQQIPQAINGFALRNVAIGN